MLAMAGQTARPSWLQFFWKPVGTPGLKYADISFGNFLNSTDNAGDFS